MSNRVGTIAYCTDRGLSHLARAFVQHGVVNVPPLVVMHDTVPNNPEWYPQSKKLPLPGVSKGAFSNTIWEYCRGLDALLCFETPFDWSAFDFCRRIGVRSYLVTMHECTPKEHTKPYKYLNPSLLDAEYFQGPFLPLPVEYPWHLRTTACRWVHRGGYGSRMDREGTLVLCDALPLIQSPFSLTLSVQEHLPQEYEARLKRDERVTYLCGTIPYHDLYGGGFDAVVQPQKYNGCSLPLQEARASGCLVLTTDRFPTNTWMPVEGLIRAAGHRPTRISPRLHDFVETLIDPADVAAAVDRWYGKDITSYSESARQWAADNSWEVLGPKWQEALSS